MKQVNGCSFERLYNHKYINTTNRKQEVFSILPMQAEIFNYLGFLKVSIYY